MKKLFTLTVICKHKIDIIADSLDEAIKIMEKDAPDGYLDVDDYSEKEVE